MQETTQQKIAAAWNWKEPVFTSVSSGLINRTWKVNEAGGQWVLQAINTKVFPEPEKIDDNLQMLSHYLGNYDKNYLFSSPIAHKGGSTLLPAGEEVYRVFRWWDGTHTVSVVDDSQLAASAAACFGDFTYRLREFPVIKLHTILPGFHDLAWRYFQFDTAVKEGDFHRMKETKESISYLQSKKDLVIQYEKFILHPEVKQRVIHHDTKISNVLLNRENKAIAVIDLDTVMPGYFISDVGDMFRTYVSPVTEEEPDFDRICIRKEYRDAIVDGYLSSMGSELSAIEQNHIYFGGEMLMYMQALRFLSDYLMHDRYYGSRYEGQNRVRAENQIRLLQLFQEGLR